MRTNSLNASRLLVILLGLSGLFIKPLNAQIVTTYAGTGTSSFGGDGGAATSAYLYYPISVACDAAGNLYIADGNNNRIRKVVLSTGVISTVAGSGTAGYSGDGGAATAADLNTPSSVALDGSGNIYICDYLNSRIRKVNSSGVINTIAGTGTPGFSGDGGAATAAKINEPSRILVDGSGNLFISDRYNYRIRKVNSSGIINTIAGNGSTGYSGDGGAATSAAIDIPYSLLMDASGNLYVACIYENRVRVISPSGIINTFAGSGSSTFGGDGGAATAAGIPGPEGLAMDGSGNIYIGDNTTGTGDNRIRMVNTSNIISTFAGTGGAGSSGDGGPATAATFYFPGGLGYYSSGVIYVADQFNSKIRMISIRNHPPRFVNRPSTSITVCENSSGNNIDTTLAITDTDASQTETWSVVTGPANGSMSGFPTSATSTGGLVYASGLGYTPTTGYSGADSFKIAVSDGSLSDTIEIYVTVGPLPASGTISGASSVCVGTNTTLSETVSGGTWSSGTTAMATTSTGGTVTGVAAGTLTISYTVTNTCGTSYATYPFTVRPSPVAGVISGPSTVCQNASITLTETATGGTWSVSNSNASVNTSGSVTGIVAGGDSVLYTYTNSCGTAVAYKAITINPIPANITGATAVCAGGFVASLGETSTGGTWGSSSGALATVDASGNVTGVSAGSVTISYTYATTCGVTWAMTVNPLPAAISGTPVACTGQTATLTDGGTGSWSSSNTFLATIDGSGVVYGNVAGSLTITYTLGTGCYVTTGFTVNQTPAAIAGPTSVCEAGATIRLTDSQPSGSWSSSNSAIATVGPTGIVTGVSHGTCTISYVISGCPAMYTETINPVPGAIITPIGDTMLCVGDFVTLTANTGTGYVYQWYDASGAITGETNDYLLTTVGNNYRIHISNTYGCSSTSISMAVSMNPDTASLVATGPTNFCRGLSVALDANVGTGLTYQWLHNGAGISGAVGAIYNATDSGDYAVVVSNRAGCTANSNVISITLNPTPINTITVSGPLAFCTGDSVTITGDTASGLTYQWTVGGTSISGATALTYVAHATGNYQLTETNTLGCSSNSAIASATELPVPNASVAATGATAFCAGGSITLNATSVSGTTYDWYQNGIAIGGAHGVSFVATTSGWYGVRVTTSAGCTSLTAAPIRVDEVVTPNIIPYSATSFCWGSAVMLGLDVSGVSGVNYQWQVAATNITGATNSTFSAQHSGDYSCIVTLTSGCSAASYAVTVTELPLPNPIISYDGTFLTTSSLYHSYEWFRDMIPVNGATGWKLHPSSTGDYTVKVIDSNGCQSTSTIYVLRSMNDPSLLGVTSMNAASINIYPNPAQNIVHIVAPVAITAVLETIDGRTVLEEKDATNLDISSLANGIYMLKLYTLTGQFVKAEKLIKH